MTQEEIISELVMANGNIMVEVMWEPKEITVKDDSGNTESKIIDKGQIREVFKVLKYSKEDFPEGIPGTHVVARHSFLDHMACGEYIFHIIDKNLVASYINYEE
jgi:hypothetical protein